MFHKIRNMFKKSAIVEEEDIPSREEQLLELSSDVSQLGAGKTFQLKREGGVPLSELEPIIGNVPWAAMTDSGIYMVAMPGPIAMITLLMSISHAPALCGEVNSLLDTCEKLAALSPESTVNALMREVSTAYDMINHRGGGGSFTLKDEHPANAGAMIYGAITRGQIVEFAISINRMQETRPPISSESLNQLIDITVAFWNDLMNQVGPVGVMETLGSNYEGQA